LRFVAAFCELNAGQCATEFLPSENLQQIFRRQVDLGKVRPVSGSPLCEVKAIGDLARNVDRGRCFKINHVPFHHDEAELRGGYNRKDRAVPPLDKRCCSWHLSRLPIFADPLFNCGLVRLSRVRRDRFRGASGGDAGRAAMAQRASL